MRNKILAGLAVAIIFVILFRYFFGGNELLVGDRAPKITFNDLTGHLVSTENFDDRYVIIDFWGSWCGPCRSSNRKLVEFYENQDTSGLKIISIGIEENKQKWKIAIKEDSLFWNEQFTPLGMFTNKITKSYDIHSTPTYFLINPDQNIIAKSGNIDYIISKYEELIQVTLQ